jgi:Raf kinase inhibitor-like YbhB/YbcL family protein
MALVTVLAVAVAVGACGTSGRELREPTPGATAPPRKSTPSTTAATLAPIGLSIVSPAWSPGESLPSAFSCDGTGVSPPLVLGGATEGAVELVVIVTDPDAGGRVHWVVAGLDPNGATIPEGTVPPGAVMARSTAGTPGWEPVCPPAGQTHTYEFAVYAMPTPSSIDENTSAVEAQDAVVGTATSSSVLTGTYERRS